MDCLFFWPLGWWVECLRIPFSPTSSFAIPFSDAEIIHLTFKLYVTIILGLIFTCRDFYIRSPFSLFVLQKTMQLAVLKGRPSPWPHCSLSHPWTPCRVAPLDPSALGIHWRNGWPALSGVSVTAATSRRFLANRSKNVMDARALIWGHPNYRMTPWKRYCTVNDSFFILHWGKAWMKWWYYGLPYFYTMVFQRYFIQYFNILQW